jgi:hypothetical protein
VVRADRVAAAALAGTAVTTTGAGGAVAMAKTKLAASTVETATAATPRAGSDRAPGPRSSSTVTATSTAVTSTTTREVQEAHMDNLSTRTTRGAGDVAATTADIASGAVAELTGSSADYPDYYHGLSRQQRKNWRSWHNRRK